VPMTWPVFLRITSVPLIFISAVPVMVTRCSPLFSIVSLPFSIVMFAWPFTGSTPVMLTCDLSSTDMERLASSGTSKVIGVSDFCSTVSSPAPG